MSAAPENSAASAMARMVDPWESKVYNREYEWLANNMVPRAVRPCFKTLLDKSQMSELVRIEADVYSHNETLLSYLPTHAGESYAMLVSHLAEQKGEEFARRAGRLRAAVLPTSHTVLDDTRNDTKSHLPEAEQSDITEIQLTEAYKRAIQSKGEVTFPCVRCMLCGQGRVGKSSLLATLLEEDFVANRVSTPCLHLAMVWCCVGRSDAWKRLDNSKRAEHLRALLARQSVGPADSPVSSDEPGSEEPASSQVEESGLSTTSPPAPVATLPSSNFASPLDPMSSDIADVVQLVLSPGFSEHLFEQLATESFAALHAWDLAGQESYRCIHSMVCPHSRAAYLIVYNATHPIVEKAAAPTINIDGEEKPIDEALAKQTGLDYVLDWLDVVYSNTGVSGCPVFVVGTHADERVGDADERVGDADERVGDADDKKQCFEREKRSDEEALRTRLKGTPCESLLKGVFLISNKERDYNGTAVKNLRELITSCAKTQPKIPACWVSFSIALPCLATMTGRPWVTKMDATNLALQLGSITDGDDIDVLLEYQHALGNVLFYPKSSSLSDKVIIDVQRVIRIIADLIQPHLDVTSYKYGDQPDVNAVELYRKGFVTLELIKFLWDHSKREEDSKFMSDVENQEFMFELLDKFSIATDLGMQKVHRGKGKRKERILLIPCVVAITSELPAYPSSLRVLGPSIALCSEVPHHFPAFLMYQLVVKCLGRYTSEYSARRADLLAVKMSKSAARLPWDKANGLWLTVSYSKKKIGLEMAATGYHNPEEVVASCSREVLDFVQKSLKEVQHATRYPIKWFLGAVCDCDPKCELHMAELDEEESPSCCKTGDMVNTESVRNVLRRWLGLKLDSRSNSPRAIPHDASSAGVSGDPRPLAAVSGGPPSRLLTDVDVYDLGDKLDSLLDDEYRDELAKEAVRLVDSKHVNNYTANIQTFIKKHQRGSPSTTNVTGVLFYLLSKKGDMTLQEVRDLVVKVYGAQAGNVDEAIRNVKVV